MILMLSVHEEVDVIVRAIVFYVFFVFFGEEDFGIYKYNERTEHSAVTECEIAPHPCTMNSCLSRC